VLENDHIDDNPESDLRFSSNSRAEAIRSFRRGVVKGAAPGRYDDLRREVRRIEIMVNRGADEIELTDFYGGAFCNAYGVEELEFSDGTVWNGAYLLAHASPVGG
jgi:hypothetical protein